MNDGLVLNLTTNDASSSAKTIKSKGGRWTDRCVFAHYPYLNSLKTDQRLKFRRTEKRRSRPIEKLSRSEALEDEQVHRPAKRPRRDLAESSSPPKTKLLASGPSTTRGTQIISSLFTSNPKVEVTGTITQQKKYISPSNAPLTDSSTFEGLGLNPLLAAQLTCKMKIVKPTAIQRSALPAILSVNGSHIHNERDIFIQSQTGSGKTLAFLLPIIQDLLPLSELSYIDRSVGTLAVIIAPTRELAKQISDVLEGLLKLRLRPANETPIDAESLNIRLTRWLVSGLLTGGSTRNHEKAKLRKGLPILVATPGRLLDHLQNTLSFNIGKCRWLVLDEADRLMDLGFEETVQGILKGLDGRRRLAITAAQEGKGQEVGGWDWGRRRTILCSATIDEGVQKLAGTTLANPLVIKATEVDAPNPQSDTSNGTPSIGIGKFTAPAQLVQKYVIVPLKLRLVVLVALLRSLLSNNHGGRTTKIIVFLSCTDSVDFHWASLGGSSMDDKDDGGSSDDGEEKGHNAVDLISSNKVEAKSSLLPNTSIYRLHGSLTTPVRHASLAGFISTPEETSSKTSPDHSSVLFCTSIASRGLDLPFVRAVIQYDLPTEGGVTEYLHRIGRTARAGKGGEAWSIVAPNELDWVTWVQEKAYVQGGAPGADNISSPFFPVLLEDVLKAGFKGEGREYESRATDVQLVLERWALRDKQVSNLFISRCF